MNKVYKVIWNKVKNCYVVASEFAKRDGKKGSTHSMVSSKTAAAVLAAFAVTAYTWGGVYDVAAADVTQNTSIATSVQSGDTMSTTKTKSEQNKDGDLTYAELAALKAQDNAKKIDTATTTAVPTQSSDKAADTDTPATPPAATEEQQTVFNENGFYAKQDAKTGHGTYNSLTKDGLWVGGEDDKTGFHVDNNGNVSTTGNATIDGTATVGGAATFKDSATFEKGASMDGQKITNVADGEVASDAVNKGQLEKAAEKATTEVKKADGDKNITIDQTADAKDGHNVYTVGLSRDLDVDTIKTTGNATIGGTADVTGKLTANGGVVVTGGLTADTATVTGEVKANSANLGGVEIGGGNVNAKTASIENLGISNNISAKLGTIGGVGLEGGNVTATSATIGKVNIDAEGTISGVKAGSAPTDAVNKGQLDSAAAKATTEVTEGKNVTVNKTVAEDGHSVYNVALKDDIDVSNVKAGTVTVAGEVKSSSANIGGVEIGGNNIKATTATITNLGVENNISAKLGTIGGVGLEGGNVAATTGTIGGVKLENEGVIAHGVLAKQVVADAAELGTVEASTITADSAKVGGVNIADGKVGGVTLKDGNISTGHFYANASGTFGNDKFKVYEDGAFSAADRAFLVKKDGSVEAVKGTIGSVQFAGNGKITGIAAGDVSATSTDAVNGSQLKAVSDVANKGFNVAIQQPDGTYKNHTYKPGDTVTVNGKNKNILADVDEKGTVNVSLNDDISLNSVTAKNVTADKATIGGIDIANGYANGVKLADGNVTANVVQAKNIQASSGEIGNFYANYSKIGNVEIGSGNSSAINVGDGKFIVYDDGALQAAGRNFTVDNKGNLKAASGKIGNTTIAADGTITGVKESTQSDAAATVGQLNTATNGVKELVGSADFSRTNYAKGAENTTQAIYDVDAQVKTNADGVAANKGEIDKFHNAGIIAGKVDADTSGNPANNSIAIGYGSDAGDKYRATAIGTYSKVNESMEGTSLGANSNVTGVNGAVALGAGSAVTRNDIADWHAEGAHGVVSVGKSGANGFTRRIINVKAGTADTDAVNVSQLNAVSDDVTAVDTKIGSAIFDHTNYVNGAKNLTQAIVSLDGQAKVNADGVAANKTEIDTLHKAGIVAGTSEKDTSIAIGTSSNANGAHTVVVGQGSSSKGEGGTIIGQGIKSTYKGATAVGQGITISGDYATALGNGASAGKNGVALGAGSVAAADTVSVGSVGKERKITNVATGTDDTDAVNVKQLKDVSEIANKGFSVAIPQADGSVQQHTYKPGDTITFTSNNDNLLTDIADDGTIDVRLNDTLHLSSVQSADGKSALNLTDEGLALGYGDHNVTIDNNGTKVNGHFQVTTGQGTPFEVVGSTVKAGGVEVKDGDITVPVQTYAAGEWGPDYDKPLGYESRSFSKSGIVPGKVEGSGKANVAIQGDSHIKNASQSIAIGRATVDQTNVIQTGEEGVGPWNGIAIGEQTKVQDSRNGTAIGAYAETTNSANGTAVGVGSTIRNSKESVALGHNSSAYTSDYGISIGAGATSTNSNNAIVIGDNSKVENAAKAVAIGSNIKQAGEESSALGYYANANGKQSVAIGSNAGATAEGSVAIGYNSLANQKNTVSFGTADNKRRLVNVADGVKDSDAATVGQLNTVGDGVTSLNLKIGTGDFSDTNYVLTGSDTTITQAIHDVDAQVKVNADGVAANKKEIDTLHGAGIVAGTTTSSTGIALGKESKASDGSALAIGIKASANSGNTVAIGAESIADVTNSTAIGFKSQALASQSTAIGQNAQALAEQSVALGEDSIATDARTVSVGNDSWLKRRITNVAAGTGDYDAVNVKQLNDKAADVTKDLKADIATTNKAIANTGILGGTTSGNEKDGAIALGKESNAGWDAIAVGRKAQAKDSGSIAFGIESQSQGSNATAIGSKAQATGAQTSAVGQFARALDFRATAYGANAIASANNSSALGGNSRADGIYSVAIGNDSVASEKNTISVGHKVGDTKAYAPDGTYDTALTRRITNVADGKDVTDAATVGQLNGYVAYAKKADGTVNKDLVKFDGGEKGTALQNVGDITMKVPFQDKDNGYKVTYQDRSFQSAGLMPGQVIFDDNFKKDDPYNPREVKGNVVAIGHNAKSYNSSNSTVIGEFSNIDSSHWSTALGAGVTVTNSSQSVSIGNNSALTDSGASVAVGQGSKVFKSDQSQAIGFNAAVYGGYENGKFITTQGNIALGTGSEVNAANNSVALGSYSKVTKGQDNVVSVGSTSLKRKIINVADGKDTTDAATVGQVNKLVGIPEGESFALANGASTIAAGINENTSRITTLTDSGITAGIFGDGKTVAATGDNIQIGKDSRIVDSTTRDNVVIGKGAYLGQSSYGTVLIGRDSAIGASSEYAMAIGRGSSVGDWAGNSMALGTGAKVESGDAYNHITNAVALGSGSIAKVADTVSFGNDTLKRRLTNVAAGTEDTDAVNKKQLTDTVNNRITASYDQLKKDLTNISTGAVDLATLTGAGIKGGTADAGNTALGVGSKATGEKLYGAVAIGNNASITWDAKNDPQSVKPDGWGMVAIGDGATVTDSYFSELVGAKGVIKNSRYAAAFGGFNNIDNSYAGTSLGNSANLKDAYAGTALGATSKVLGAKNAVALGAGSVAAQDTAVSVGRSADDVKAYNAYVDDFNAKMESEHPGDDNYKLKKLDETDTMYRRITSVAAGTGANDAVIVSQFNGKNGAGEASFLSAVGKIDWNKIGNNADTLNKLDWTKLKDAGVTTASLTNLANAKFSFFSAVQPTVLAADETVSTDDKRAPGTKDDSNTSSGSGTRGEGIKTTADKVSVDRDLDVAGNTTVGKDLTVKGNSTFEGTAKFQKGADMGGNKVTNVADGSVDKDSKDAINGSQLYTEQQARIDGDNELGSQINSLAGSVHKLGDRVDRVGAGAAALAALHPLDYDPANKWDFAAGYGNYKGASAVSIGSFYRPNENTMLSIGGSFGGGENMVNAGVSFKFGDGQSTVGTSRAAMANEITNLKAENKSLTDKVTSQDKKLADQDAKIKDIEAQLQQLLKAQQPAK